MSDISTDPEFDAPGIEDDIAENHPYEEEFLAPEGFRVHDEASANWVIRKIAEARGRVTRLKALKGSADSEIDGEVVAAEDELGEIPEHVQFWMQFVFDRGVIHNGDFAFEPMLSAINDFRANLSTPLPFITSVANLSNREVNGLVEAFNKKQLEFGLV